VSPDGTQVAVSITDENEDIWVWDFRQQRLNRVTSDTAADRGPVWTQDGQRIVFHSLREGPFNLYAQLADGTGPAERLIESTNQQTPSGVSPDGKQLLFFEAVPGMRRDLFLLELDGTRRVRPLLQTPFEERNGLISPNGHWLVYESDRSGRFEIYVRPFPDVNAGQWPVSTAGGMRPIWARSGHELFFVAPDGALMTVRVADHGSIWDASTPVKLVEGRYYNEQTAGLGPTFDIAPDGKRFLMIKEVGGDPPPPAGIIVAQHWVEELKRLVPTK
jgi:serine/threonine-protein kinase